MAVLLTDVVYLCCTVNVVGFAMMAVSTYRLKYLWVVYMCILAAYGVSNRRTWRYCLRYWNIDGIAVSETFLAQLATGQVR